MKILIIGAGALGSYFGGLLQKGGNNVTLVSRNKRHLDRILEDGLYLETNGKKENVIIDCISEAKLQDLNQVFQMVFIFTKSKDTHLALNMAKSSISSDTPLISLQNGIGNEEILRLFSRKVFYGCTTLPSDLKEPGTVSSSGHHITLFDALHVRDMEFAFKICSNLNACGIKSEISNKISEDIWKKAIFNSAVNVICALIKGTPGEIKKSSALLELSEYIVDEGCKVAQKYHIYIKKSEIMEIISMSTIEHANHKPSMLVDILNGKITEIDSINGKIISLGKNVNVHCPNNKVVYSLIKALENKFG